VLISSDATLQSSGDSESTLKRLDVETQAKIEQLSREAATVSKEVGGRVLLDGPCDSFFIRNTARNVDQAALGQATEEQASLTARKCNCWHIKEGHPQRGAPAGTSSWHPH